MNENIDLTKILKDCPKGTKLYSPIYGEVVLDSVQSKSIYTLAKTNNGATLVVEFNYLGRLYYEFSNSECVLFPSKDQRDWSKFAAHWHNKEKFDTKILEPLIRYW